MDRVSAEQIMRRAEAIGLSPERVARALNYRPPPPVELQETQRLSRAPLRARLSRIGALRQRFQREVR